jgi:hypothetical protein
LTCETPNFLEKQGHNALPAAYPAVNLRSAQWLNRWLAPILSRAGRQPGSCIVRREPARYVDNECFPTVTSRAYPEIGQRQHDAIRPEIAKLEKEIACSDPVAYRNRWISEKKLVKMREPRLCRSNHE